jgi:hypothetical protein
MGFVQAGFLVTLAAIAIPVIIHLAFARPRRRVELGTLRFLQVALTREAGRKRVKRWLLLALRTSALAWLTMLFARPFLVDLQHKDADRLAIVLVDRSGSMALESTHGRSRDQAAQRVQAILGQCGAGTEVKLAYFDHVVRPIVAASVGRDESLAAAEMDSYGDGCSTTDFGAAMGWARDLCLQSARTRQDIYLLTDLQRCGLGHTPVESLPRDARVHVIDVGQPYPRNAAVTRVTLDKPIVRPHEPFTVQATVMNASQFGLTETPVVLHLQQGQRQRNWRSQVSLDPGAISTLEFELPELDEGLWQGFVMIECDDELSLDNRRYLAVLIAPPVEVLTVDGDPTDSPITSETYFLAAALRLAPSDEFYADSPFLPRVAACINAQLPEFGNAAAIVLANTGQLSRSDADRLARFVNEGGGVLIFGGNHWDQDDFRQFDQAGIALGQFISARSASEFPWRLEEWNRDHPVFKPFSDPQYGDLQRMSFRCFADLKPADGTEVLARFQDGSPALIERQYGRGKVLWFASSCDRDWGDWPRSRLYVPLIHQLIGYLLGLTEGGPIRLCETDRFGLTEPDVEPGVYDRGGYHEVVNVNARESETDRATVAEFADQFHCQVTGEEVDPRSDNPTEVIPSNELRQDEVWYWALIALVVTLCAESFLANRTTT